MHRFTLSPPEKEKCGNLPETIIAVSFIVIILVCSFGYILYDAIMTTSLGTTTAFITKINHKPTPPHAGPQLNCIATIESEAHDTDTIIVECSKKQGAQIVVEIFLTPFSNKKILRQYQPPIF